MPISARWPFGSMRIEWPLNTHLKWTCLNTSIQHFITFAMGISKYSKILNTHWMAIECTFRCLNTPPQAAARRGKFSLSVPNKLNETKYLSCSTQDKSSLSPTTERAMRCNQSINQSLFLQNHSRTNIYIQTVLNWEFVSMTFWY